MFELIVPIVVGCIRALGIKYDIRRAGTATGKSIVDYELHKRGKFEAKIYIGLTLELKMITLFKHQPITFKT